MVAIVGGTNGSSAIEWRVVGSWVIESVKLDKGERETREDKGTSRVSC